MLLDQQQHAVKWYIGDVNGEDPFWGDPKAYVTVNALFFPGIAAEQARALEGKRLNPAILEDAERLQRVLRDLLSAFTPLPAELMTYRVERYSDYRMMLEQGTRTLSFTSTSTAGFLKAYQDRSGIALMRFRLPPGTPCIDMSKVLECYAKSEEAEILLPPGLQLTITEQPLLPAEREILDADGRPPYLSVTAVPNGMRTALHGDCALPDAFRQAGIRVLRDLSAGNCPSPEDVSEYVQWKRLFTEQL